jgi:hypothetical protein
LRERMTRARIAARSQTPPESNATR